MGKRWFGDDKGVALVQHRSWIWMVYVWLFKRWTLCCWRPFQNIIEYILNSFREIQTLTYIYYYINLDYLLCLMCRTYIFLYCCSVYDTEVKHWAWNSDTWVRHMAPVWRIGWGKIISYATARTNQRVKYNNIPGFVKKVKQLNEIKPTITLI